MKKEILFFDIETEGNPEVFDIMPEPTAPANYKDADKIAAFRTEPYAGKSRGIISLSIN